VNERDVLLSWRNLFLGKEVTAEAIAEAEELLDGLAGESPLHLRLGNELEELKKRWAARAKKQRS
jgi:hypothetical protein